MSLNFSTKSHVRTGATQRTKSMRAGLLASACFAATNLMLATGMSANDITVTSGVVNTPVPGSTLWALPVGGTTTATVDTAPLNATPFGLNAIWIAQLGLAGTDNVNVSQPVTGVTGVLVTSTNDTVNINNSSAITGTLVDGVFVANTLGGTVTINGAGTFDGLRNGIWVRTPGDTNIGTVGGPLGAVTGGVNGVVITESVGNTVANLTSAEGPLGYGVWTLSTTGNQTITATGETSGTTGQYLNSVTGNISTDGKGTGTLIGSVLDGTLVTTLGDVTVNNYATVEGLRNGIYVNGSAGTTSIQGNGLVGGITGTLLNGIVIGPSSGDVHVGDTATNGVINALANGIWVNNSGGSGNTTIVQDNDVTGGVAFSGIVTSALDGATSITSTAATTGGLGIWAISTTGNIFADGGGTGVVTGTTSDGILFGTATGDQTVQNFATVTGQLDGMWLVGSAGTTNVQGNGLAGGVTGTTRDGIVIGASTGDVNIGTIATNGVITGDRNGIWVNNLGAGNTNIVVDKNVTGTNLNSIIATSVAGDTNINIAAGATVQGLLDGVATGTITGTSTTTNAGIIKNINDTGAADTAGALAYWALAGTDVLNNTGTVIGGINTAGIVTTVNNDVGGVWIPSLANVMAAPTTVNNAGLIDIRTGATIFAGNSTLTNLSGGVVDLTYGGSGATANAQDTLTVLNFAPHAGSTAKFNVDFTQAHLADDVSTANGSKGTADTIIVTAAATPVAKSVVALNTLGSAATGSSGSIALVATTAGPLKDPGLGGYATIVASTKYALASDPSTGAVVYRLVDDGNGGVYLQWAPNVSAKSLGGFGGAAGAGTAAGSGLGGTDGASPGAAIASSSNAFNGVGGLGLSGGPSGGGAAGRIADLAAGGVLPADPGLVNGAEAGGGSMKDGPAPGPSSTCLSHRGRKAWAQGEATRSNFEGGNGGRAENLSGGIETDLGNVTGRDCDRVAVGVFGFTGWSGNEWETGRADTRNSGVGAYIRAASAIGLYGSLLGAWNWADQDLTNKVIGSTADRNSDGFAGVATLGYVAKVASNAAIDLRTFIAYGNLNGDGFTDSAGFVISGSEDDLVTVGGSLGLHVALNETTQGFVRGGVKWAELNSSITAFGITQSGSADEVSGSVEAGFVAVASEGVHLGISGFGEFSDSTTSYGGRAHVGIRF